MSEILKIMTLGDLRRRTAQLRDDTAIVIEVEDVAAWHELAPDLKVMPGDNVLRRDHEGVLDDRHVQIPDVLLLGWGQEVTLEYGIEQRYDAWLESVDTERGLLP